MKHIILQFTESPEQPDISMDLVEYDKLLNLNVVKGTKIPAVTYTEQATDTFTKTYTEGSDSDRDLQNELEDLMATTTATRTYSEALDSDPRMHSIQSLTDTSTQTFVNVEQSDSDKGFKDLAYLSETRTLTEANEALDSDK